MRSEILCSRALMAGFSASSWAESTASRESCWDDADERVREDIGKSTRRRGGVAEAPVMIAGRSLSLQKGSGHNGNGGTGWAYKRDAALWAWLTTYQPAKNEGRNVREKRRHRSTVERR